MDPLSITAASFSIAGAIAKASIAIVEFSHQAKDASEDLQGVSRELQALAAILNPLTLNISRAPKGTVTAELSGQLESSLYGCALVVAQIDSTIDKYQKDGGWTRTKWVLFGRGDMEKLRGSLEAYKMALSLGLQFASMAVEDSIKNDTGAIRSETQALRNEVATVQVNTEEILARVVSLRNGFHAGDGSRTMQWVESMAVLSSYAESTYQETVIDAGEEREVTRSTVEGEAETIRGEHADPVPISELDPLEEEGRVTRAGKGSDSDIEDGRQGGVRAEALTSEDSISSDEDTCKITATNKEAPRTLSSPPTSTAPVNSLESQQVPRNTLRRIEISTSDQPPKNELDVVVALDLGESSAAVAWMSRNTPMQMIREWPGSERPRLLRAAENEKTGEASNQDSQHSEDQDSATSDTLSYSVSFLCKLYTCIKQTIVPALGLEPSDWEWLGVEFHVTAPDVFHASTPDILTRRLSDLKIQLREAGIGTGGPRHYAVIGPTETEAIATAVIYHAPALISPSRNLMLKIGTTHATVFLLVDEPPGRASSIWARRTVKVPEFSLLIEDAVCRWLEEDHPEAWEKLGSVGPGPVAQTGQYRDFVRVLCGSPPQHESYRLQFDGLPRHFTNRAFEIRNGSIEFNREHIEYLFNLLVDTITKITKGALLDVLREAAPSSSDTAQILQDAMILEAPDTPERLMECVLYSLDQTDLAVFLAVGEKDHHNKAMYESTFQMNRKRGTSAAHLPALQDGDLAAVEGLLLNRNPWNFAGASRLECNNRGLVWLYTTGQIPCGPDTYLSRREPGRRSITRLGLDPWLSPTVTQRWNVTDWQFDRHRSHQIALDFYFIFDGQQGVLVVQRQRTRRLKLCTAIWELEASDFDYASWRRGWRRRRVHYGSLDFTVQFDLLQPFEMGPRLTLQLNDGPTRLPTSLKWHGEPPFAVWPTRKGDK